MTTFDEHFYPIFGVGCAVAILASLVAGWAPRIYIMIPALLFRIIACWGGLFLGAEIGYREWQSLPDPPPEAFADTFPMGAMLAGWLPAGALCLFVFGITITIKLTLFQRGSTEIVEAEGIPDSDG